MPATNREISSGSSIIFRIPATFADTQLLGFSVNALFANLGFDKIDAYKLELAIIEAAHNIVKHSRQEEDAHLTMKFAVTDKMIICTFVDYGEYSNFLKDNGLGDICTTSVQSLPSGNRGIAIICDVMDEVRYKRAGHKNVLTLVKYFS